MNNFYGILKIVEISDIKIDYYNKCKFSYNIICLDNNIEFKVKCNEKFIEKLYSNLKVCNYILVYGSICIYNNELVIFPKYITAII